VKNSLSKILKDENPSMFTISSFKAESIKPWQASKSSPVMKKQIPSPYDQNSSVSSWSFPVIEKEDEDSGEKEDLKTKLARLEKEAYEKGFEQGQRDGLALEKSKMEEFGKQLETLFTGLRDLKPLIYSESEGEILKLAIMIARKIIHEEIKTDNRVIVNTIKSALSFLVDKRKLKILINPDDMEEVRSILPDLSRLTKGGHFQLTEDHTIDKGGCILETGFGRINATIVDQLSMLEEEIENRYCCDQVGGNGPVS
jgi:flagellar biosynthesis/type III secretory pathway protein FliH